MIAKVNDTVITADEVEQEIDDIIHRNQANIPQESMQTARDNVRPQAVETCINRVLLFAEVQRRNIHASQEKIDERMDKLIKRFPSDAAFEQRLSENGVTRKQIEDGMSHQIRIDELVKESIAAADTSVTDDEVAEFFKNNRQSFITPEEVRASHILLKTEANVSDSYKSQKRLELAGLAGQIEKGADFGEVAKQHSECPSGRRNGDLGFFKRGEMVKPFEDAAFNLGQGEISDIVETQFGYHLIKVVDRKEAKTYEFGEVKDKIQNHLIVQKEQDAFIAYINELRGAATIEYPDA